MDKRMSLFWIVTRSYYRGAAGALLVYDTTSRDSFNALSAWLNDARTLASPNIVILLVGNKRDLEEARAVTLLEASNFAQENELIFLETSAKTGDNVEEAFLRCSKSILAKIECGELDPERTGSGIQYGKLELEIVRNFCYKYNIKQVLFKLPNVQMPLFFANVNTFFDFWRWRRITEYSTQTKKHFRIKTIWL